MPLFIFKAIDKHGQEISGSIEGDTQEQAKSGLRLRGFFVTRIVLMSSMRKQEPPASYLGRKVRAFKFWLFKKMFSDCYTYLLFFAFTPSEHSGTLGKHSRIMLYNLGEDACGDEYQHV